MANVSIAMLPEPGHYIPTLRFAHALREAGNSVCYVTLPQFYEFFQQQGFTTRLIEISGLPQDDASGLFAPQFINRVVAERLNTQLARSNIQTADFIRRELCAIDSDLLICDLYFRKFLGSEETTLRSPLVFLNVTLPKNEMPGTRAECRELVLCPYAFEIPRSEPIAAHLMYGEPSIYRRRQSSTFPWSELKTRKQMVYCSFGSQAAGYPSAACAFQCLGDTFGLLPSYQFVLVTDAHHRRLLTRLPDNVLIVESAPQPELLRRAAAFITHAGLGSVKEAISARVPMIAIPFAVDQPANASRLQHHQLGYACRPQDCNPDHLANLLTDAISNSVIRSNLETMSNVFRETERKAPILNYLKQLLDC